MDAWRIGVDVGGTFTDLVLVGTRSGVAVHKVPSTPQDPTRGVLAALDAAAGALGETVERLLAACTHFVHGTTIATNTVLEGKGARTGMLVTSGFRDAIEIRRGLRENVWDQTTPWPAVLVPRALRRPVRERTLKTGEIEAEVEEADVAAAAEVFRTEGVEAVAVAFVNSFLNDANEARAASLLREHMPDAFITTSSGVAPVMGEYERSSTAAVNAAIAPRVLPYLEALDRELRAKGLPGHLLLVQSNGGAVAVADVAERPVALLLSGPAAGVGALAFYAERGGLGDLMTMEIGGTSCDVMMMRGGAVAETQRLEIAGYPTVTPAVEIHTVGTGGGTIASADQGGMLTVGPEGAGARPGPAAYGFGGERPTVTDAHLVLGRLASGTYAGGALNLDEGLAREAIDRHVARPLGLSVEEAAIGIIRLTEQNVLHALETISSEKGVDPTRFTLVACGGAGALHGVGVARLLGARRVFVPKLAGVFCAFGMCNADIRHDAIRANVCELAETDLADIRTMLEAERAGQLGTLSAMGFADRAIRTQDHANLRYRGQQWTVEVPIDQDDTTVADVRSRFEARFEEIYGYARPAATVELVSVRAVSRGVFAPLDLPAATPRSADAEPATVRRAFVDARHGFADVAIHRAEELFPGARVTGPAIVEEATTTVLVGAGDTLTVDGHRNHTIEVAPGKGLIQ